MSDNQSGARLLDKVMNGFSEGVVRGLAFSSHIVLQWLLSKVVRMEHGRLSALVELFLYFALVGICSLLIYAFVDPNRLTVATSAVCILGAYIGLGGVIGAITALADVIFGPDNVTKVPNHYLGQVVTRSDVSRDSRVTLEAQANFPLEILERSARALRVTATDWGEASTRLELSKKVSENVLRAVEKETGVEWSESKREILRKYVEQDIGSLTTTHVTLFKPTGVVYVVSFLVWLLSAVAAAVAAPLAYEMYKARPVIAGALLSAAALASIASFWIVSSTWPRFIANMAFRYVFLIGGGLGLFVGLHGVADPNTLPLLALSACGLALLWQFAT